ncbi:MAG TPA: ATPase [Candidatus Paceibacterota bacterium]|nr:ATPase [Candidatus Paceibacterota bacterium]
MRPEIIKADGTVEEFDGMKLEGSLVRAGASVAAAERIRHVIESSMGPLAESSDIYRRAFQMLRTEARPAAARYSLRRALFDLGPTGHPFEDFVAEIFKKEGWIVEGRRMIQGKCVPHEVDVYAKRGNEHLAAELKYHNSPGYKTDIKVALYVKARFDDIWQCREEDKKACPVDLGYLITNTKFTRQAIDYARCSGMGLLGWSYPQQGNLYDRIIANALYPITVLTTLKKAEKRLLIDQGIVTSDQVREHRDVLRSVGLTPERIGTIVAEVNTLHDS